MWNPQIGSQTSAYLADWVDELFYGGERGGGKSDLQLGYQEKSALTHEGKSRGIMFRKTYAELEELQSRAMEIFPASGAIYKTQPSADYPFSNCWYWPNKASVKMRYIENERDYGRYHGHQYCVGVGTPILMADGSWKPIELIKPGEMVQTLEGVKEVLACVKPYLAPCVKVFTPIGSQIQPVWHPLLTSVESSFLSRFAPYRIFGQLRQKNDPWQSYEYLLCRDQDSQGKGGDQEDDKNGCTKFADAHQENQPLPALFAHVMLVSQLIHQSNSLSTLLPIQCHNLYRSFLSYWAVRQAQNTLAGLGRRLHLILSELIRGLPNILPYVFRGVHGSCGAFVISSIPGCYPRYFDDNRQDDGQLHHAQAGGLACAPLQVDVGVQAHDHSRTDEMDCILECSRQGLYKYIHPYTKEMRRGGVRLELGKVRYEHYGEALVCDLTIKDANHYISKCGLINKNSNISFDEVTEYQSPDGLLKMLSTLRSASGVPCSVRLTGNPGGVGHGWVKDRYISVTQPYRPYIDPDSGFIRLFIPSKTSDNAILLSNDPDYRSRLRAATGGNDALRKAWLEGDWDIVAGAFFDCWQRSRHVVTPFHIPDDWLRFRSGDWGSARPFSFGWWAVVGDDYHTNDGLLLPRGCLVRYKEWYGMKRNDHGQPMYNVGLKMVAEEVGRGIAMRDASDNVSHGVLDPSAFSHDGGESIYERIFKGSGGKVIFRRADNSRVAKLGSIGGWDQVRSRLIGDTNGNPMLVIFSTCEDSIRTLPIMQHDKDRIEDIDTEQEDHVVDDIRYACMSRPYLREKTKVNKPKYWEDSSLDELWRETSKDTRRI